MMNPIQQAMKPYGVRRLPANLVNTDEVAAYLRCSRRTVERLVKRGVLRPMQVGRCWRFDMEQVVETLGYVAA